MNIIPRFPALVHVSRKTTQNVTCNGVYMIYETRSMWHHISDTRFKKKKKKNLKYKNIFSIKQDFSGFVLQAFMQTFNLIKDKSLGTLLRKYQRYSTNLSFFFFPFLHLTLPKVQSFKSNVIPTNFYCTASQEKPLAYYKGISKQPGAALTAGWDFCFLILKLGAHSDQVSFLDGS